MQPEGKATWGLSAHRPRPEAHKDEGDHGEALSTLIPGGISTPAKPLADDE